ncbi:MAG: hypothetical protein KDE58_16335, partial [Caldilineaceae bacterium]|nr:hypothetical protein [Caldilineaceae bacterium]
MKRTLITLFLLVLLALLAVDGERWLLTPTLALAQDNSTDQGSDLPPAPITNDEGGPKRLVGSIDYADFGLAIALQDPSPALLDMVYVVQADPTQFAPVESQILGYLTSPAVPPPLGYAFNLPEEPIATLLDVDNDGEADSGVQIFNLVVGANLNGGSYLEQLDQWADLNSYLTDVSSGRITEGSLLVYAPDNAQGFPNGFGDDGILFTADDPAVALPQGYTVVHFGADGFTFDRAEEAELNVLEMASAASPDFSNQAMVESFNSLIDQLRDRYSFTDLRQLDWDAIRAEYLPQVEEAATLAEQNSDVGFGTYANILHRLAQSIHDAHVASAITDLTYLAAARISLALQMQPLATNVGASTVELSDGRIIVSEVVSGSPADTAGWGLGTEIVAIDGTPVADYLPTVIYNDPTGTEEGQRLFQVNNLLKFPAPEGDGLAVEVTIDAILTGDSEAQRFTLTPGVYPLPDRLARVTPAMPASYRIEPGYGYLTWDAFHAPEIYMAVLEQFLTSVKAAPSVSGLILDLRGNSGGWDRLYFTMASYFFNADNPVSMHWIDQDSYDPMADDLVREVAPEYLLSAPQPDLYYGGPLVILIDQNCASSCEFFSQFLQTNGRATVVAQHASKGAGAPINEVKLPSGIIFHYTKGRAYFAGTDEMNLEGKGVTPDIRVPVTEESVAATLAGADPVLAAGVRVLDDLVTQAFVDALNLAPLTTDMTTAFSGIYPEGWTPSQQGTLLRFIGPGQQYLLSYDGPSDKEVAALLAPAGISDPDAAQMGTHTANDLTWTIYQAVDANNFVYGLAIAEVDGQHYLITLGAPPARFDALLDALLYPAIDAFVPAGASETGVSTDDRASTSNESMPASATLSIDALKNGTYSGIDDEGAVTLTDGLYEGEPLVAGGAARPRVEYIDGSEHTGDLDGDG